AEVRRHVENELPEAIVYLGNSYRDGRLGLVKSMKKAAKLYKRAVELGNLPAMVSLGMVYEVGYGEGQMEEAFRLYKMAAEHGLTPAEFNHLGNLYRTGQLGLVKSAKKAAKIYKRALELGNVNAMLSLGELYEHGEGEIKMDKKKARQLFQMAADRGLAKAQCNLASCFHRDGQLEEAFRHFKMAAEQGLTTSQYNVGVCYEKGVGVERDVDEAKRWYARAAAKG
ncbi:hypothetical protein AURANDRAFT_11168, partial [Aureococcus anophagefferens]